MKMQLIKKVKLVILLIILCLIILMAEYFSLKFFNSDKINNEKNAINLSYNEWVGWKPILDAKINGYYDNEGIEVNLSIINDIGISSNALIKGDLNAIGCSVNKYALLYDKFKKNNLPVVMPYIINYSSGEDGIIAKSSIKSIEDLEGKKIGIPKFSEQETLVKWFVDKSNLTNDKKAKIQYIYFSTPNETAMAFFSGQLDAAATWQPYLSQAKDLTDSKVLIDTKNANNLIMNGIIFKKEFVDKNPETVKKFIRATLKASADYNNDYTALRDNMSLFALQTDKEIKKTLLDNKFANYNDNIKMLSSESQILFKDMSNIWISLGEKAYPNEFKNAFNSDIMLQLADDFKDENILQKQVNDDILNNEALLNQQISIEFKPNSSIFLNQEETIKELNKIVEISKMFNGSIIKIEGNLANINNLKTSTDYDIILTKQRAESVANYLISQGINKSRLIVIGNGINNQITNNSNETERKKNRRTDIKFLISK